MSTSGNNDNTKYTTHGHTRVHFKNAQENLHSTLIKKITERLFTFDMGMAELKTRTQ